MVNWKKLFRKKPVDPEVKQAYSEAFREARIERAKEEGLKAGKTKPKSFLDKIGNIGEKLEGLGGTGSGNEGFGFGNVDNLLFGSPTPKKKTKKKRKRRKK